MQPISDIRRDLPGSGIRAIFDHASQLERQGKKVLHLEIGRPDWPLSPQIANLVTSAVEDGYVHYLPNRGLLDLRSVWSEQIESSTGRRFDPENEMIITVGASEAVCIAALALLGPGDEMIVPEPAWPHYKAVAAMAGADAVTVNLRMESGFSLDVDDLRRAITPRTRLIVINTPGNPTGAVQSAEVLRDVAELALRHGIYVLSDEVYQDFVYGGEHLSIGRWMGDSDHFLYINSLSKSHAMTGWRIGVLGATPAISDAFNRVHQYLTVCGVAFAQKAAAGALRLGTRDSERRAMQTAFADRRRPWLELLAEKSGMSASAPRGAFYLFPRIESAGLWDVPFCRAVLAEHQLAMVPGSVFGADFSQFVRISYGGSLDVQTQAVGRLRRIFHGNERRAAA